MLWTSRLKPRREAVSALPQWIRVSTFSRQVFSWRPPRWDRAQGSVSFLPGTPTYPLNEQGAAVKHSVLRDVMATSLFSVQVFQELAEYDVSDAFGAPKEEGHFWWPGMSSRRRRRSSVFPWHWDITKDARFAFTVRSIHLCSHSDFSVNCLCDTFTS